MPTQIDWGLLRQAPDFGEAFQQGYRQSRGRSAMSALARDPTNVDALANLYEVNPEAAIRMETVGRERSKWQRDQTALDAQRAYITSRYGGGTAPNALAPAGSGMSTTQAPPPGPSPAQSRVVGTLDALAMPAAAGGAQLRAPMRVPMQGPPSADPAWLAYAQADPAGAMKVRQDETEWQSTQLKLSKADLEAHQAVNLAVGGLLGGVRDQASYDAAKAAAAHMYERYGYEMPEIPAVYSPEVVQALQRQSMEVKDVIAADLAERKFGWQQQDDRIDNARDDRRVAITDRSERNQAGYRARADHRSQVRFGERALDRAAIAGVRTDTSDLDY